MSDDQPQGERGQGHHDSVDDGDVQDEAADPSDRQADGGHCPECGQPVAVDAELIDHDCPGRTAPAPGVKAARERQRERERQPTRTQDRPLMGER